MRFVLLYKKKICDLIDLTNNFINGIAVNGPSIILFGDNVTIHCGIAKFNYLENINWKYRPLNSNAEVPILQSISEKQFCIIHLFWVYIY